MDAQISKPSWLVSLDELDFPKQEMSDAHLMFMDILKSLLLIWLCSKYTFDLLNR